MRKKKIITLILFVLLAAVVVVVCFLPSSEPQVVGAVSPNDLAEIKRVISREIWRGTFPDHSWATIKRLPGNIINRYPEHILRIDADQSGMTASATIKALAKRNKPKFCVPHIIFCFLQKKANGWEVANPTGDDYPVLPSDRGF